MPILRRNHGAITARRVIYGMTADSPAGAGRSTGRQPSGADSAPADPRGRQPSGADSAPADSGADNPTRKLPDTIVIAAKSPEGGVIRQRAKLLRLLKVRHKSFTRNDLHNPILDILTRG